jgi:hypothetical protein
MKPEGDPPVEGTNATAPLGAPPERRRFWNRRGVQIGFASGAAFLIGVCIGVGGSAHWFHRMVHRGLRNPERMASKVICHMKDRLELTDAQAAKIRPLLVRSHTAIVENVARTFRELDAEIEQHLTEEQIAKHRAFIARHRARFFGDRDAHKCTDGHE